MMRKWICTLLILPLIGCMSFGDQPEKFVPARPVSNIIGDTMTQTAEGAWDTVQMPLEDLNLKREPIPEKLQHMVNHAYMRPLKISCTEINNEIAELDLLLGPDLCTIENPTGNLKLPPVSQKGAYVEQGAKVARAQAIDMVRDRVNIIPLRGVVRYISGAEAHSRELQQAYEAGRLRRAFLKGLLASPGADCLNPHP